MDLQVSVANGDVSVGAEVVGESHVIGSIAGTPQEAEARRHEPPQDGIAGADEHIEQVTGTARPPNSLSLRWGPLQDLQWKLAPLVVLGIRPRRCIACATTTH